MTPPDHAADNRASDASTVTAVDPDLEAQDPELALERVWSRTSQRERAIENGADPEKTPPAKDAVPEHEKDPFLVTLHGREHINPHTWGTKYRWFLTLFAGTLVLNCTFSSSAPSNLIPAMMVHFGVSEEVGILTISLFVAGYCLGPLFWGPLSERYGRRIVFIASFIPYILFQMACALAPNIGAMLAFRFLGGCFAAAPLTNVGSVIADLWGPDQRGDALAIFSCMPTAGPALAPIISGFMYVAGTDYRWIFWVLMIFAGVCFVAMVFLLPETYVPFLLQQEAKRLRKETGDGRWISALERSKANDKPRELFKKTVAKPFIMLFQEPMLAVLTLYVSFIYGLIYLLFEAIPIVFVQTHGLNAGEGGLVFLALLFGCVCGCAIYMLYYNKEYIRLHHAMAPKPVPPEVRLKPVLHAAPFYAASFFWFGWAGEYKSTNIAGPIISVWLMGVCILLIFLGIFNYLIDAYLWAAASALAINTVCRSAFGAGFPLFATQMYRKLGTGGASSLLGGIAVLFIPAPWVLMKYGQRIRMMSKNAVVLDK